MFRQGGRPTLGLIPVQRLWTRWVTGLLFGASLSIGPAVSAVQAESKTPRERESYSTSDRPRSSLLAPTTSRSRTPVRRVAGALDGFEFESDDRGGQRLPRSGEMEPAVDANAATGEWWDNYVNVPMRKGASPVKLGLEDLLMRAVNCSEQIKVFGELPLIRRTGIVEADAAFDWTAFMDARWNDNSDPVGNSLTVGGTGKRFFEQQGNGSVGLRQRNEYGGKFEIAQKFGYQENNSTFFTPSPQGNSRFVLSYTHPLMRGSGRCYNQALIVLARIDTEVAEDEFSRQLQSHLLEVSRGYWSLYLERANLAQRITSYRRASETRDRLRERAALDAVQSQVVRADAETASRQSAVVRAEAAVKNAEDRIRALLNDPSLCTFDQVEIIPQDVPADILIPVEMTCAISTAIQQRPEVGQAIKQIRAASVRLGMAQSEMLPVLNLVTESYVAGLRGDASTGRSYVDQFSKGRPSYSAGLQFEVPLENRAARARFERRELEMRQLRHQYQTTLETLQLEVRVAVREVETSFAEMAAQRRAMEAGQIELDYLEKRWIHLPGENGTASLVLDNLLAAQDRLAKSEYSFLNSQVTYNLSMMNLKRATGELLQSEHISMGEATVNGLPQKVVDKSAYVDHSGGPRPAYSPAPTDTTNRGTLPRDAESARRDREKRESQEIPPSPQARTKSADKDTKTISTPSRPTLLQRIRGE